MKMEFQNTEQVPFMQNDQRRVRGTTLFLAELFVHFSKFEDVSRFLTFAVVQTKFMRETFFLFAASQD